MQKEPKSIIISKLRERGCRITRQRRIILDIILDEDCSCCKEIYYKACKQDSSIGAATVYRMVNTLEEIGVINRKNMYKYTGSDIDEELECVPCCRMELDDGTVLLPNERYPLEKELFRLYFTSLSDEQSSLKVWVEDTFGQTVEVEFSFNNDNSEKEGER